MSDWQTEYRVRKHYTITEAAYLLNDLNPSKGGLKQSEINSEIRKILKAVEDELLTQHRVISGYGNPDKEARITSDSFKSWCEIVGKRPTVIFGEESPSSAALAPTDDMPETLKAVIAAWNEFGPDMQNRKIGDIEGWIRDQFPGLTTQKHIECAQVVTGGAKPGRTPKSPARPRLAKEA